MLTWRATVRSIGTALAVLAGSVAGLSALIRLSTRGRILPVASVPKTPVALVLGAAVRPDGVPSGFLRARLDLAAQLYARGAVERLLLSGDGRSAEFDEPGTMRAYLAGRGVPAAAMMTDPQGLDTFSSCRRAVEEFGISELVVVSQRFHLPRALAICSLLGVRAWGVGDESFRSGRRWAWGVAREVAANLKLCADILSYRLGAS